MAHRCGQLVQGADRFRRRWDGRGAPRLAVVDVDNAAGAADGEPAVSAEGGGTTAFPAKGEDGSADGAFVDPAADDALFVAVPFDGFAAFADDCHTVTVAPPVEIGYAAFTFDADFGYPLAGYGI